MWWIIVDDSVNNNLENIISYSNTNHGLYLESTSTWNTISWATLYSNTKHGLYVNTNSSNNIFKNINSYSNTLDWLFFEWDSNNNMIINSNIYNNTRRWIYISGWWNNFLNNLNIFNNNKWLATSNWAIEVGNASFNNSLNNINLFNNSSNGIFLKYQTHNTFLNNIYSYNNRRWTSADWVWIFLDDWSWSILNNVYSYNNYRWFTNWSVWVKYYWDFKYFWNQVVNEWIPDLWSDWYIWLQNWNLISSWTMDCNSHSNPNNAFNYWLTCLNRGFSWSLIVPTTSFNFWSNISKQKRPVKWNSNTSQFELYWTDWIDYNTSKFIWEF